MLFHTIGFFGFLSIVFFTYWFVLKDHLRLQNLFLLAGSYFFYSCWDWRFLILLLFSTLADFFVGARMAASRTRTTKKRWLWFSVFVNLGVLGIFKYYNFFAESFADALSHIGMSLHPAMLGVVLPVGISFYTFHGLSYVIDIYRERIAPEEDFVEYALFVSFFPLLVAGPIERATHLLPQIKRPRVFDSERAVDGLKQILWGLFKKVVVADNCAEFANQAFTQGSEHSGSTLFFGAVFFAFQIYGDFSGYSDIASGSARLLGIELLRNFSFPYFSRDIAEFWRRWHISLSSWFRDYVYIELGGSRGGAWKKLRNTFAIFLLSGFWHGANWTFLAWGALNALYFLPLMLLGANRNHIDTVAAGSLLPSAREGAQILGTFLMTVVAWVFFRSSTMADALVYLRRMIDASLFSIPEFTGRTHGYNTVGIVIFFTAVEWVGRDSKYAIERLLQNHRILVRWAFYSTLIFLMGMFKHAQEEPFLYFQF